MDCYRTDNLNGTYISSNGTHLGIRGDGSPDSAVQASTSPGGRPNTNLLHVATDGNLLGLVGSGNSLIFVELSDPPSPPPNGTVVEWEWWRLFPSPDFRVRMADMSASVWMPQPNSKDEWLLSWFKGEYIPFIMCLGDIRLMVANGDYEIGNVGPGMSTVTLFWESVPL